MMHADAARMPSPELTSSAAGANRAWLWPALASAVVALAAYAITLHGTLVYDDVILHTDARYGHPSLWKYFWTKQYWPHGIDNLYRPLSCMTLAVQYWLHGELAWPYHLVNILLHAGVAAAVAEFARRLLGLRAAWIAGLLFAIHPVHVEVVAGIVGRMELLSTLLTLIALCIFLRPLSGRRIVAIAVLFLAGVFSKEQGLLLAPMILALTPYRNTKLAASENRASERERLKQLAGILLLLLGGYLIFRESILRFWWPRSMMYWVSNPLVRSAGIDRVLMPIVLLGKYTQLLIAPVHLSVDYESMVFGWQVNYHQPWIYIGLSVTLAWLVLMALCLRRRNWAVFFLLIALGLSYGIIGNIVFLLGTNLAERLMYMPSAFFLMIIAAGAARLRASLLAPAVALLVVLGSWRTVTYARLWNDPLALYQYSLSHFPHSLQLYGLVVEQYQKRGDQQAAREVAHRCIEAMPGLPDAYAFCIELDMKSGNYDDAAAVAALGMKNAPDKQIELWQRKVENARRAAGLPAWPAATLPAHQ